MKLDKILTVISHDLSKQNMRAIVVGGAVRDYILGIQAKDFDIEIYGIKSIKELEKILCKYGSVNLIGKSFGVLKFTYDGRTYDFSLPRKDSKSGDGHRGFSVLTESDMDFDEAAKRRDFTINAMGYDIESGIFIDPFNGAMDIKKKIIRHIDSHTFVDDPLRVYRAIQFAARFKFEVSEDTFALLKKMVKEGALDELPKERIYEEWKKFLLQSDKPSIAFYLMRELGIIKRYFPELHLLINTAQDPRWHPEGDVWTHSMMAVDEMAMELKIRYEELRFDDSQKLILLFAILCHDLGKPLSTSIEKDGRIRSIGHERAGLLPTKSLISRLTDEQDMIKYILPLVEHHLKPPQFYKAGAKAGAIRRLSVKVDIDSLILVAKADSLGRGGNDNKKREYLAGEWLSTEAQKLNVLHEAPKPFVRGRDLIASGMKPSPKFAEILDKLYQLQLDGEVQSKEEAMKFTSLNVLK